LKLTLLALVKYLRYFFNSSKYCSSIILFLAKFCFFIVKSCLRTNRQSKLPISLRIALIFKWYFILEGYPEYFDCLSLPLQQNLIIYFIDWFHVLMMNFMQIPALLFSASMGIFMYSFYLNILNCKDISSFVILIKRRFIKTIKKKYYKKSGLLVFEF